MARQAARKLLPIGGLLLACAAAIALAIWGVRGVADPVPTGPREKVGLMTSLPLYWPDGMELDALAQDNVALPRVRQELEQRYELMPLDTLAADDEGAVSAELAQLRYLAVIQPRGLTPADNVALDAWVQDGGKLLLVLDPMLIGHYAYSRFDPRHPVGSALIPPVVTYWGLHMSFDDRQPLAPRPVEIEGVELALAMAGEYSLREESNAQCAVLASGAAARCAAGEGSALLLADATPFEDYHGGEDHGDDHAGEEGETLVALFSAAFN